MNRSRVRILAAAAVLAAAFAGSVATAGAAAAEEAPAPVLYVAPTPVVPQPVVAGHEGDVLLQVNVAMPAQAATVKRVSLKAHKATRLGTRAAQR